VTRIALFFVAAIIATPSLSSGARAARAEDQRDISGLRLTLPAGVEVTTKEVDEGVEVVAITRGEEVLLLTVYRKWKPPQKALEVTLEELTKHVRKTALKDSVTVKRVKMRLFNKWRSARRIDYVLKVGKIERKMQAHVVAGPSRGRTVVASWNAPRRGIAMAFSPDVIRKLRSLRTMPKRKASPAKAPPEKPTAPAQP